MNSIAKLVQARRTGGAAHLEPAERDEPARSSLCAPEERDRRDRYLRPAQELRLDERQLTAALGVSRTPIREALSLLEQEGFIRTVPRRGIYIIRKSKREIIEMIQMWAALESMAARLATLHATDAEIATLGICSTSFRTRRRRSICANTRMRTSRSIRRSSRSGGSQTLVDATRNLLIHVRAIRRATIAQDNRAARSIVDHLKIIEALENGAIPSWRSASRASTPGPCGRTSIDIAISWGERRIERAGHVILSPHTPIRRECGTQSPRPASWRAARARSARIVRSQILRTPRLRAPRLPRQREPPPEAGARIRIRERRRQCLGIDPRRALPDSIRR